MAKKTTNHILLLNFVKAWAEKNGYKIEGIKLTKDDNKIDTLTNKIETDNEKEYTEEEIKKILINHADKNELRGLFFHKKENDELAESYKESKRQQKERKDNEEYLKEIKDKL